VSSCRPAAVMAGSACQFCISHSSCHFFISVVIPSFMYFRRVTYLWLNGQLICLIGRCEGVVMKTPHKITGRPTYSGMFHPRGFIKIRNSNEEECKMWLAESYSYRVPLGFLVPLCSGYCYHIIHPGRWFASCSLGKQRPPPICSDADHRHIVTKQLHKRTTHIPHNN